MTAARVALVAGILFLATFAVIGAFALHAGIPVLVVMVLFGLIASGNLIYGRSSHYAKVQDRTRAAQEAHDSAADRAADARRAATDAAKRGDRYCPLDPANNPAPAHPRGHAPAP